MLKNKYYQVKVLLKRFHSNGNPINLICRLQRFHHLIVRLYLSPWKWKVPFVYFSVILKKWCFPHMGSKPIFHHFIVVLGSSLTWSRLKNRFWWILPWKRYPKIRNQDLRRECCSLRTADRFSSLIAAEGRFAKRPLAAMSEEKRLPLAG